jgi:hypothetical protein
MNTQQNQAERNKYKKTKRGKKAICISGLMCNNFREIGGCITANPPFIPLFRGGSQKLVV